MACLVATAESGNLMQVQNWCLNAEQKSFEILTAIDLPIANVFALHQYEFPVASLQRRTATRFSTGIAFLNDVLFLLILGVSSTTSSRNYSPDIGKSFFQFPL